MSNVSSFITEDIRLATKAHQSTLKALGSEESADRVGNKIYEGLNDGTLDAQKAELMTSALQGAEKLRLFVQQKGAIEPGDRTAVIKPLQEALGVTSNGYNGGDTMDALKDALAKAGIKNHSGAIDENAVNVVFDPKNLAQKSGLQIT